MAKLKINKSHHQNYRIKGRKMIAHPNVQYSQKQIREMTKHGILTGQGPFCISQKEVKSFYIKSFGRNSWNHVYRQPARHVKKTPNYYLDCAGDETFALNA